MKIEEVLGFFPDFEELGGLKGVLCEAVSGYRDEMTRLTRELDEATMMSDLIRDDLRKLRKRYWYI